MPEAIGEVVCEVFFQVLFSIRSTLHSLFGLLTGCMHYHAMPIHYRRVRALHSGLSYLEAQIWP